MRNDTRLLFNAYASRIAQLSGVADPERMFNVDPTVAQTMRDRMIEQSDFLQRINIMQVDEMKGQAIGLGSTGLIASRTDTSGEGERVARDPTDMTADSYECAQTNYDTVLTYAKLDAWAKFKDFETRVRNAILRNQALDRIRVGFNGISVAATTNRVANPLGQDVNKGWLQKMRDAAPANVLASGKVVNKLTFGAAANADYKTIDAMVYSAVQELLDEWHRDATDLVAIVGRDLLQDKYFPMINKVEDPTEQIARDTIMSTKRLGNLPAFQVPFFPAGKVLITSFDNLSIYEQEGKRRRMVNDNPRKNGVENFESSNDAFVIEDLGKAALLENIEEAA